MAREISPQSLQQLMDGDETYALIGVRAGESFRAGQIFRSTTVPLAELRSRLPVLIPVLAVTTVLRHHDGGSSKAAAIEAEAMGYSDLRWLAGGFSGWIGASQRYDGLATRWLRAGGAYRGRTTRRAVGAGRRGRRTLG